MKDFLIFSILICFVAMQQVIAESKSKFKAREKVAAAECIGEMNLDEMKYNKTRLKFPEPHDYNDDNLICMRACITKKLVNKDLIGPDDKTTLYNGMSQLIETAINEKAYNEEFAREVLLPTLNDCKTSAQSGCEFYKCSGMQAMFYLVLIDMEARGVRESVFDWDVPYFL